MELVFGSKDCHGIICRVEDEWGEHLEFKVCSEVLFSRTGDAIILNADWIKPDDYEWFCNTYGKYYQEHVRKAYELGRKDVQDEMKKLLGINIL